MPVLINLNGANLCNSCIIFVSVDKVWIKNGRKLGKPLFYRVFCLYRECKKGVDFGLLWGDNGDGWGYVDKSGDK